MVNFLNMMRLHFGEKDKLLCENSIFQSPFPGRSLSYFFFVLPSSWQQSHYRTFVSGGGWFNGKFVVAGIALSLFLRECRIYAKIPALPHSNFHFTLHIFSRHNTKNFSPYTVYPYF